MDTLFVLLLGLVNVCLGQSSFFRSGGFSSRGSSSGSSSGRDYVASWEEGENSLTWSGAQSWCQRKGMRAVNLDNSGKASRFLNILGGSGRPYAWTGGRKSGDGVSWNNGNFYPSSRGWPWSSRSVKSGQSQPDGGSNEQCIAILDIDFYGDGPHLHDIECNHRKPVICEN